jgi:hypothetical protein
MGLVISKGLTLRKGWQPMDTDAAAYITAVETADGQALEEKTKIAIDNFVLGCKQDGIWNAIKASCILAGARTRLGALTPLVGTAPTSFNFVDGDYNRKTGLVGNGSTKYLNSNRNNNADPQDSQHLATWQSSLETSQGKRLIGAGGGTTGRSTIGQGTSFGNAATFRSRTNAFTSGSIVAVANRLIAVSRSNASNYVIHTNNQNETITATSEAPSNETIEVFRAAVDPTNARLAFYSIGESLDLALLDARVTDLINAFGAAIP